MNPAIQEITNEDIANLRGAPDGELIGDPVSKRMGVKIIRIYEGNKVSLSEGEIFKALRGESLPVERYPEVRNVTSGNIKLPDRYSALVHSYNNSLANGESNGELSKIQGSNLGKLVSFFCSYKPFGPLYENYISSPDEEVELSSEPIAVIEPTPSPSKITTNCMRATAHVLILLMGKNFTSTSGAERDAQVTNYLEGRMRALRYILGDETCNCLLSKGDVPQINGFWNRIPKLKHAIFSLCVIMAPTKQEFGAALTLLEDSSMVVIKCMEQFIKGRVVTQAHLIDEVLAEMGRFIDAVKYLQDRLGTLFPFYRVLEPSDTSLAASKFPNLSRASVLYVQTYINTSESFKRVAIPSNSDAPELDNSVSIILPSNYFANAENADFIGRLSETQQNVIIRLGVDINKWAPSQILRERLYQEGVRPVYVGGRAPRN